MVSPRRHQLDRRDQDCDGNHRTRSDRCQRTRRQHAVRDQRQPLQNGRREMAIEAQRRRSLRGNRSGESGRGKVAVFGQADDVLLGGTMGSGPLIRTGTIKKLRPLSSAHSATGSLCGFSLRPSRSSVQKVGTEGRKEREGFCSLRALQRAGVRHFTIHNWPMGSWFQVLCRARPILNSEVPDPELLP